MHTVLALCDTAFLNLCCIMCVCIQAYHKIFRCDLLRLKKARELPLRGMMHQEQPAGLVPQKGVLLSSLPGLSHLCIAQGNRYHPWTEGAERAVAESEPPWMQLECDGSSAAWSPKHRRLAQGWKKTQTALRRPSCVFSLLGQQLCFPGNATVSCSWSVLQAPASQEKFCYSRAVPRRHQSSLCFSLLISQLIALIFTAIFQSC